MINSFATGITGELLEGLAGDPDDGVLWAVSQTDTGAFGGTLYEIDPSTGAIIESAQDASTGYEQDLGYDNHELFVSDAYSGPGTNFIDVYDTATLSLVYSTAGGHSGLCFGSGRRRPGRCCPGRLVHGNVQAGQQLSLQSSTPSDQGGQFPNTASLEINLYDTSATWSPPAPNWRTAATSLFFNAPVSGQYHIEVSEDPGGAGEYYCR